MSSRVRVAVAMPVAIADGGDFLANVRALDAAGAAVIVIEGDEPDSWAAAGAVAASTLRIEIAITGGAAAETLQTLSRGRLTEETGGWPHVDVPPTREGWTQLLRDQQAAGAAGIVVPWDPSLIDLLRNPEPDDRSDLLMSTG